MSNAKRRRKLKLKYGSDPKYQDRELRWIGGILMVRTRSGNGFERIPDAPEMLSRSESRTRRDRRAHSTERYHQVPHRRLHFSRGRL